VREAVVVVVYAVPKTVEGSTGRGGGGEKNR